MREPDEKLNSPEKLLDRAKAAAESARSWAKGTASKLAISLSVESAKTKVNKLLDDINNQIEGAYQSLKERVREIDRLSYADDFASLPESKRIKILADVEKGRENRVFLFGDTASDNFFDFDNKRYRIDRLPPAEQERIRGIRARGIEAAEAGVQANIAEGERIREEEKRRKQAREEKRREDERISYATSEKIRRDNDKRHKFEEEVYQRYRKEHFASAFQAEKELMRLHAEEAKQGKPLEGEELKRAVELADRAHGIDKKRPPVSGTGGEPTDEEVEVHLRVMESHRGPENYRNYLRHFNKGRLHREIVKALEDSQDPDYLKDYSEWKKGSKGRRTPIGG